jgi:small GTP-binding protein
MRPNARATKVVLLGSSSVGKTSIIRQLTSDLDDDVRPTLGAQYQELAIPVGRGGATVLHVWDTAGEERFAAVLPMYLRGVAIAILVCATDPAESVGALDRWLGVVQESRASAARVCVIVNKIDLDPAFDTAPAREWAKDRGFPFFVISALQRDAVDRVFRAVAEIAATLAEVTPMAQLAPRAGNDGCC